MIHKTTRSILSVLLAALLLVTSTPLTPAFAEEAGAVSLQSESGVSRELTGDGTAGNPYQISSAAELWDFAKLVNGGKTTASAVLTDDIDLNPGFTFKEDGSYSGPDGEEPHQWIPIGTSSSRYSGTFDGDGHTISGLYIDSSDNDYQGLFGYVSGTVKDLSVSGSVSGSVSSDDSLSGSPVGGVVGWNFGGTVTGCAFSGSVKGSGPDSGRIYVGGVVGYNSFGTVTNCYNTGNVSVTSSDISNVGGVVGYNHGGRVENCYNTGTVTGNSYVGGVVGQNFGGTVENCYNTGEVSGVEEVGGVVGNNYNGSVENSYNTGAVSGVEGVGGVVGQNFGGTVENCYNTGSVSDGTYTGGVVGWNVSGGTVTGCYFLQGTAGNGIGVNEGNDSADATPVDDLDALCEKFENDPGWSIHPVLGRPVLNENWEGGLGTDKSPYEISTADELKNFATAVNDGSEKSAHAKLMNNIDLNGNATNQWTPIGTSSSNSYRGTFDGNGHKIENLYINTTDSGAENQGLFGLVGRSGKVQNLTVSGSVKGHSYVGGVVGYNNGGTVTGCIFSGSGSVSGSYSVGGVVGRNFDGTVENCYNTGSVNGSADSRAVGGVVGRNNGTVENCYNTGSVSGPGNRVGGVVGYNRGTVTNCYNIGEVSGNGSDVGGVVGYNDSNGSVTNCYFLQTETVNTKLQGIGKNEGTSSNVEARTADAFHSGEVAWLLENEQADGSSQVWGQNIGEDKSPVLTSDQEKTVYRVPVDLNYTGAQADQVIYTNSTLNAKEPTREGYTFDGWYDSNGNPVTAITATTAKLYAHWTAVEEPDPEPTPDPEPEEPPYTGKYSYEVSTSVGDHGSLTVDRYATEGDKVTIDVTPDQAYKLDDLSVTANGKDVELTANGDGTYTFTMPSADVKITATFAEDPDWTEPEEPTTDVSDLFIDIAPNAWYKDAVQYAYDNGLMTGVSATEFAPEATTTRAMIVSILARLEGVTTAEAAGFADVDDEWYATAVNWAANVGVVNGYEDNTFQPNTAITREQLAAILMNYAAYKGEDVSKRTDLTSYTDQPSTWAQEAMQWAVAEKLITGVTNDELQPQGNATRAQVAAILQRFLTK